jgi:hypothetical protein
MHACVCVILNVHISIGFKYHEYYLIWGQM